MKTNTLVVLLFLFLNPFFYIRLDAQELFQTYKETQLNDGIKDKLNQIKKRGISDIVSFTSVIVKVNDIRKLQSKGKIKIKIPGTNLNLRFKLAHFERLKEGGFIWNGKIDSTDGFGYINLLYSNGHYRGDLVYEKNNYNILPLGEGFHIFFKKMDVENSLCVIPQELTNTTNVSESESAAMREDICSQRESVRVLTLFSTRAKNYIGDINAHANSYVNWFNQAMVNSGINKPGLMLAGAVELPFRESETDPNDPSIIPIAKDLTLISTEGNTSGSRIDNLRNSYQADIIVMFVDTAINRSNYIQGRGGLSFGNIEFPLKPKSYMIMLVDLGGAIFSHEIGHLFSCSHQRCSLFPTSSGCYGEDYDYDNYAFIFTAKPNAFTSRTFQTAVSGNDGNIKLQNFSNPSKTIYGKPTGTARNNNAQRITNTYSTIANFTDYNNLSTFISGPTSVPTNSTNTYEAIVTCGYGTDIFYHWEASYDGGSTFNYLGSNLGGSNLIDVTANTDDPVILYLYVAQQSNNTFYSAEYYTTIVPSGGMFLREGESDNILMQSKVEISLSDEIKVFPNPSKDLINIELNFEKSQVIDIELISNTGVSIYNQKRLSIEKGRNIIDINSSNIASGLYNLSLKIGDITINKRVSIIH